MIPHDIAVTLECSLIEWRESINIGENHYKLLSREETLERIEIALGWIEAMQKVVEEQNQ